MLLDASVGGGARGGLTCTARPTPARSNRALNTESEHTMRVACGPLAAAPAMSRANVASARRPAGGLSSARRAVAPLRARRVVAPMRRAGAVAVSASLGEFPAWDAAADVARDVHATIVTNDAVSQLFQIADAAPAEGSPRPAEGRLARAHHGPPRVNPEGTRGPLPTASSSPPLRATRGSSRKAQIIPSLARAPRARTLTLRAFASHPVPSPTDPSPPVPPLRDSRVSTAPSRASTCRTPTATPSSTLTLLVKVVTFPLTKKQVEAPSGYRSHPASRQRSSRRCTPNDPERLQMETARLYKEANFNPLAGCLPTFATLPVFIGLYRALSNAAVEGVLTDGFYWIPSLGGPASIADRNAGTGFAWLTDFSSGAPFSGWHDTIAYLVLPVLLVVSQFASQRSCSRTRARPPIRLSSRRRRFSSFCP